jgi:hypothetical protein
LFVGSTKELQNMLKGKLEEIDSGNDKGKW